MGHSINPCAPDHLPANTSSQLVTVHRSQSYLLVTPQNEIFHDSFIQAFVVFFHHPVNASGHGKIHDRCPTKKMTGYHSPPHFSLDCSLHFVYHLSYTSIEILGYKLRLSHQLTSCTSGHIFNQHVLRSSQICSHTMEAQKKTSELRHGHLARLVIPVVSFWFIHVDS